jgi:hypothetical protein
MTAVASSRAVGEGRGLDRYEYLTAVARSCNARRPVDIDADVALLGPKRVARVDAHSHANRAVLECRTGLGGRGQPFRRFAESEEEGVALCVDLDTVVALACCTQYAPVLG